MISCDVSKSKKLLVHFKVKRGTRRPLRVNFVACLASLLDESIVSISYLVEALGFYKYSIMY